MKNVIEKKAYYADTDAYGVVWHGSYLRWLEAARVELCEKIGMDCFELDKMGIIMPITEMSLRYKSSALCNEVVLIETEIEEVRPLSITFSQTISNKADSKVRLIAKVTCVAIDKNTGKLFKRLPEPIVKALAVPV